MAALSLLALATAGCQLDLDVGVDVDRDGGGRLTLRLATDEALADWVRANDAAPLDVVVDARGELESAGWRVTEGTPSGGGRSVELSRAFADPAELRRLTADLAGALAGPELTLLEPMDLTVTEERVRLQGAASLRPTDAVDEHGLSTDEAVALLRGQPPATMSDGDGAGPPPAGEGLSYRVTATLPGEVLETTATERDGRTLTWAVPPGEEVTIRAVARRPGPPRWPLALGALAGAGGAAVGLALWRRRRDGGYADDPSRSAARRFFSART